MINAYIILAGKQGILGVPRCRWDDYIKMYLMEIQHEGIGDVVMSLQVL
jgi:hypothetical protein